MKIFKLALLVLFGLSSVIILAVVFLHISPAKTYPIPSRKSTANQETLIRGKYLVDNVAHCQHCHSPMQNDKFGFPSYPDSAFSGTFLMGHEAGLPGEMYTANLTPYFLGKYSDDELFVALTQGIAKDGHTMFPIMPYMAYGTMDPEDVWSMIDYLRTLPAIKADRPKATIDFPVNMLVKLGAPEPKPVSLASLKTEEDLGKYMVTVAGCLECHTPENEKHEPDMNLVGAGGRVFIMPDGAKLTTPNISSHADGLGTWTMDRFVNRFKQYDDSTYQIPTVSAGQMNTYMAWHYFAKMKTEDLQAIYKYLKTLPAHPGRKEIFQPATALAQE